MRKILILCLFLFGVVAYGQLDTINTGTTANDGTGESLRSAMFKVNDAIIAHPYYTGTFTVPAPFTLGSTSVTTTGAQLNYLNAATGTTGTTSTNLVFSTSPTLVTPNLGTPSAGTLTNCTFPTLNQNTTGSAATLTTPRAIYGNNFDGSAALTQVIASTYGGTGNGFTKFTGPTTAEKTFTLPDASATLLYSGGALGTPSSGTLTNCSFPTLNQNTTGSAATLTTARTIGGVPFDGSANITVASATGGFTVGGTFTMDNGATIENTDGDNLDITEANVNFSGNVDIGGNATIAGSVDASTIYSKLLRDTTYATDNYTLVLGDAGNWIDMNVAAEKSLTIPPHTDVAIPVGTEIYVMQAGAGIIGFTAGAGVTLAFPKDSTHLNTQYRSAFIRQWAEDKWVAGGLED